MQKIMHQKNRTIVSAVIISQDGKILLGKVRKGGVYPDCWHIPGGGVDEGEDKETALVREIKEELGLDIQSLSKPLISDSGTDQAVKTDKDTGEQFLAIMQFNVYQINLDQPAMQIAVALNDDLTEYQWVEKFDLKNYKHTPPSQKLFSQLGWI
jgi:8-oxo-dGTP pyrophosphatase MutT (NUDIX family)